MSEAVRPSLHFEVLTELPDVVALTSEWESLLSRSTCNHGFGSAHWFIASCRNAALRPYVIVARYRGTVVGILPLVLSEDGKQAGFANHLTDYNDAIAAAKDFLPVAELLRFACLQPNGYRSISLKHLRTDSNCLQAMNLLNDNGFAHTFRKTLVCYYLQLPVDHEGFLKSKDSRFRKRLKRLQALARNAGLTAGELDPASFPASQLPDLFLNLHLARRKVKSCFEVSATQNFAMEVLPPLFEKRAIRACVLMDRNRIVAIDLYTTSHNSLCVWNGGFLDEFEHCSPGKLLINEGIKLAFAAKADEFDFLRGSEPYKESWVNNSRSIGQLEFVL